MLNAKMPREDVKDGCGYRNILRFDTVQSWLGCSTYPVGPTLFVTDKAPNGSLVNGNFNKLKKTLSDTLVGGHTTMACNSNYVATVDSNCWLSSKNSPRRTMFFDLCEGGSRIADL